MEEVVSVPSAGLQLHGVVSIPAGIKPGNRRAAFLVLHGFGGNSDSAGVLQPTHVLNEFGYATLRFDMRGCGKSEGEFGRVIRGDRASGAVIVGADYTSASRNPMSRSSVAWSASNSAEAPL